MCTAIVMKVVSIDGYRAMVEVDGVRKEISLRLLPKVVLGDWVLVHAGYAIEWFNLKVAGETLELIKQQIEE